MRVVKHASTWDCVAEKRRDAGIAKGAEVTPKWSQQRARRVSGGESLRSGVERSTDSRDVGRLQKSTSSIWLGLVGVPKDTTKQVRDSAAPVAPP